MAETLYIENFGPIKKAELDLRQAMVLIGPQSSGKSAIAKLISILRDWDFVNKQETFEALLEKFNAHSFLSSKTIIKYNSRSHGFQFGKGQGEIIFDLDHKYFQAKKKFEEFEALYPRPELTEHQQEILKLGTEVNALFEKVAKEPTAENKTKALEEMRKYSAEISILSKRSDNHKDLILSLLQFTNYSQYIPAERILIPIYCSSPLSFIQSKLPIPQNILDFGVAFEKARQANTKFKVPFLNFRYSYESGTDMVYFNEKEGTKLNESSSGLQTLIPMLVVIAHKWTDEHVLYSFVIEEPEQNLYPLAQQQLVYHLSERCLQYDEQRNNRSDLVVTTHSPYVLTSFNNLLFSAQVAEKTEDKKAVYDIIPEYAHIKSDDFNAYYVAEGTVREIFDRKTGLIAENELDSASEEIMYDFNALMEIYKRKKSEGGN